MVQANIIVACCYIWRARNNFLFSNIAMKIGKILEDIKVLFFLWIKNSAKSVNLDWGKGKDVGYVSFLYRVLSVFVLIKCCS